MDLAGPYDVLQKAMRAGESDQPLFEFHTVARTKEMVTCHGGLQIVPEHIYPDAHIYDVLLIPGGPGHQEAMINLRLLNWISRAARLARVVAATGTGTFLLAAAHLLDDQPVAAVAGLTESFSGREAQFTDSSVVKSGKILTSCTPVSGAALGQAIVDSF